MTINFKEAFTPETTSFDPEVDDNEEAASYDFGTVLNNYRDYLTKEELVCISLFKNSKKKQNQNKVYSRFLETYMGKKYSSSSVSHKKKKALAVLKCVGELVRYKKEHNLDNILKEILTNKQYVLLMLYERRILINDIQKRLKLRFNTAVSSLFGRVLDRLQQAAETDGVIKCYLKLLGNIFRYSRRPNINN